MSTALKISLAALVWFAGLMVLWQVIPDGTNENLVLVAGWAWMQICFMATLWACEP